MIFQVSQPYNRTGQTKVFNRRILVPLPIPLAAHNFPSLWPSAACTSSPFTAILSLLLAYSVLSVLPFLAFSLRPTLAASSISLPVYSCKSFNLDDKKAWLDLKPVWCFTPVNNCAFEALVKRLQSISPSCLVCHNSSRYSISFLCVSNQRLSQSPQSVCIDLPSTHLPAPRFITAWQVINGVNENREGEKAEG